MLVWRMNAHKNYFPPATDKVNKIIKKEKKNVGQI